MRGVSNKTWLGLVCCWCLVILRVEGRRLAPHAAALGVRGGSDNVPSQNQKNLVVSKSNAQPVLPVTAPPPGQPIQSEQPPVPEQAEVLEAPKKKAPSAKWANVRQRTLPAVIMLGALAAWVKFLGDEGVIALVFVLQALLYSEATSVANVTKRAKWWWFLYATLGSSVSRLVSNDMRSLVGLGSYCMAALGVVAMVIQLNAPGNTPDTFRNALCDMAAGHLALLVLVHTSSYWISTVLDFGLMWVLYPLLLVIVNDTMAYVFGMIMGKHPLLPVISPKKTWEGFAGATLSTLAVAIPLANALIASSSEKSLVQHALVLATYVSLIAPFGGFLASITKRAHDKKDFGALIPGHGGVVDRLDCQVVTAPFVYLYLKSFL